MTRLCLIGLAFGVAVFGCSQGTSSAPLGPSVQPEPSSRLTAASASFSAVIQASSASAAPSASLSAGPTVSPPSASASASTAITPPAEPALLGPNGAPLPQTDEQPSVDSPVYHRHVRLLFDAIVNDDPEIARTFFFPVVAYEQVKAIEKPARDWRFRLWKNFVRDVHEYHKQLGPNPSAAVFERMDVRTKAAKWMKPGAEGNKLGYYRVTRSKILGKKSTGARLELDLTSMISWRGEWYLVHLHGVQ